MDKKIYEYFGFDLKSGDVGIEIELEGGSPFPYEVPKWWRVEEDGSLRGYSAEYVMKSPAPIAEVKTQLQYLKGVIEKAGGSPKFSERAGVHVHVNVQDLTIRQMYLFAFLYYCFEQPLVKYCGPMREGNHFCLRIKDADFVVDVVQSAIDSGNLGFFDSEDIRYSSLNFCSLSRYGSLEFRAMESQPDFSKIEEWANMLYLLREFAKTLDKFSDIPFQISAEGPTGLATKIFGAPLFEHLNYKDFDLDVMRGIRPIQHLFYKD